MAALSHTFARGRAATGRGGTRAAGEARRTPPPTGEAPPPLGRPRLPGAAVGVQYEPTASSCDQAAHGEPYTCWMYPRPQRIWVAGLVCPSAPAPALFGPGDAPG